MNKKSEKARSLTYQEFPQHFVYYRLERKWKERKKGKAIGRISHATPSSGEMYYLRILLTKIKGPTDFVQIRTVEGTVYQSFREACFAMGLLDDDSEYVAAIREGAQWASGYSLRRLFVSMLLSSCLQRPEYVWGVCSTELSDDLLYIPRNHPNYKGLDISEISNRCHGLCNVSFC